MILATLSVVFLAAFLYLCFEVNALRSEATATRCDVTDLRLDNNKQHLVIKGIQKKLDTLLPDWRDDAALTDVWTPNDQRELLKASERIPGKGSNRRSGPRRA